MASERRERGEGKAHVYVFSRPGRRWTSRTRFGGACPQPVAAPR